MRLTKYEQETIINFNEDEDICYIFTYNRSWQQHLEKKLELKPTSNNGYGGRGYELPKRLIRKPQKPRQLSDKQKQELRQRLPQKSILSEKMPCAVGESGGKNVR